MRRRRTSPRRRLGTQHTLAVLLCAVLLATGVVNAQHHHRLPAGHTGGGHGHVQRRTTPSKRDYDNFSYYVLELEDGSSLDEAASTAELLGAELVEQVGELRDHWLLRAAFGATIHKRSSGSSAAEVVSERDHVLERYASLLTSRQTELLGARSGTAIHRDSTAQDRVDLGDRVVHASTRRRSASSIISLERQELRKRVKRQLPPSPADPFLNERTTQRQQQNARPGQPPADQGQGGIVVSQYLRDIASRFGIEDPLFPKQWHLANDQMQDNSINVTGVWEQGVTGNGIRVAIVDDGLDMHSDDLKDNFFADGSWDYNDHTDLPEPRLSDDQHGTRCAGEIAAAKNDVCGVGVAYDAQVAGIRILSASISDADEASALNFGYQENDIYSCSWGPPDDGRSMEAPSRLIYKSMLNGVQNGRGGKGSVFVFASGNGGAVDDQCNFDGYTNSIYSITISAIDRKGLHPFYSEGCSANMVVTYSSGSGDNIHTTDVGTNKCTDHHGGTSAAAPIAAGIFALALQVRPELTWRDMQHICVQTAIQVNPTDPDWQTTAAGRPFNHKYGYGKLDAYRIVERARTFEQVKPQAWFETPVITVNQPMTKTGTQSKVTVTAEDLRRANFETLEHVQVTVNASHQRRGNIEVWLESPNGVKSILARPRRFDDDKDGYPGWTFMSVKHWDENPVGDWTLTMLDRQNNDKNGTFIDWNIMFWGQAIDASAATPYKMAGDSQIHLPAPPHHALPPNMTLVTTTIESGGSTWVETQTVPLTHAKTKTLVKPTAHLPGDHGEATGESDHPLEPTTLATTLEDLLEHPTPTAAPAESPTPSVEEPTEMQDEDDVTYLGPWGKLAGNSSWLYVAAGSVIIFLGAAGAFLLVRSRRRGARFHLIAGGDDDGHPMSALERGRLRLTGQQPPARTKALYDAFALSDSEDEDEGQRRADPDNEREGLVGGTSGASRESKRPDDQYMASFLGDDDEEDEDEHAADSSTGPPRGPRSSTPASGLYRDDEDALPASPPAYRGA